MPGRLSLTIGVATEGCLDSGDALASAGCPADSKGGVADAPGESSSKSVAPATGMMKLRPCLSPTYLSIGHVDTQTTLGEQKTTPFPLGPGPEELLERGMGSCRYSSRTFAITSFS